MKAEYAVGATIRWGRGHSWSPGLGWTPDPILSGVVVAVVPAGAVPFFFRSTLPKHIADRWSAANAGRYKKQAYLVEVQGDPLLHFPHPSRILDPD